MSGTTGKNTPSLSDLTKKDEKEVAPKGSDPVLEDDETYAEPVEGGTLVNKQNFDNRGNGVTDNMPNDWDETFPSGATTSQTPSENASTRHTVVETTYAEPADVDDKFVPEYDENLAPRPKK